MYWWVELGYPPFEEGHGGFPRTGQVIKHYRENTMGENGQAWTQRMLARALEVTEKTVGEIENRDATLDFARRQRLCQLFAIPPLLSGIRTFDEIQHLVEQERAKHAAPLVASSHHASMFWWVQLGYPAFATGSDGFPRPGQVVRHYRLRKSDETGNAWIQRDLAEALMISDQAAWDLENRDASLVDMERRRLLCRWFAIPSILLGITTLEEVRKTADEKRRAQPVVLPSPPISHKLLIDPLEYESLLTGEWHTFISNPTQTRVNDLFPKMDNLYRELPHVRDAKPLNALLCRYHDLVANVWRDKLKYDAAIEEYQKAWRFAQLLCSDELKALVLYEWGYLLWQKGAATSARQKYDEARCYEQNLPSNLRGCLLLDAGRLMGEAAPTKEAKREAIALIDRVEEIVQCQPTADDPYFLQLNLDRYHLTRSAALIAVSCNKDAIRELRRVEAGPFHPRRQACRDIYQAQAQINLGEYDGGIELAESGLASACRVDSEVLIARIEQLYQQLARSPYKNSPHVAQLDFLLHKRRTARKRL